MVRTLCFHCRGTWVESLVGELVFHMLCSMAKKINFKNQKKKKKRTLFTIFFKRRFGKMQVYDGGCSGFVQMKSLLIFMDMSYFYMTWAIVRETRAFNLW